MRGIARQSGGEKKEEKRPATRSCWGPGRKRKRVGTLYNFFPKKERKKEKKKKEEKRDIFPKKKGRGGEKEGT